MSQILLIDDEHVVKESITAILEFYGHEVTGCENVLEASKVIKNERHDLIITDMRLPMESNSTIDDEGGLKIIQATVDVNISVPIIVITGFGSIENTVNAMRFGAYDYLTKPIDFDEFKIKIQRALQDRFSLAQGQMLEQLPQKTASAAAQLTNRKLYLPGYRLGSIIGKSKAIQKVREEIRVAAGSTATVLIQGESGTGKELVAKAIHYNSDRGNKALITLNCAAFPQNLIEDELFGHRKGAFSTAIADRRGTVEEAEGNSLFLDEIGEMPLEMQPRLLRILEQKEVKRIGENITKTVDVRIIAATNKELELEMSAGRFRPDLFERLNIITLNLPPLRRIKEDIPLLVEHFIHLCHDTSGPVPRISDAALYMLVDYDWPRNVRELRNVIERTLLFMDGDVINEKNLRMSTYSVSKPNDYTISIPLGETLEEIKLEAIRQTLDEFDGNKTRTAKALGISTSTLWKALKTIEKTRD